METAVNLTPPLQDGRVEQGGELIPQNILSNRDRPLTVEEIAEYFQVKPKTVYNWAMQGLIPCYRITNRILRFDLEKVKEWFKGFEQPGRKPYKSEFDQR